MISRKLSTAISIAFAIAFAALFCIHLVNVNQQLSDEGSKRFVDELNAQGNQLETELQPLIEENKKNNTELKHQTRSDLTR